MFTAQQFRTEKQTRRAVLDTTEYGNWQLAKIFEWDIYRYLLLSQIEPRLGTQSLWVVNVTKSIDTVARFYDRYHNYPPEKNEGGYALVSPPDGGIYALVLDSDNQAGQYYTADLPIYVGSGADAELSNAFGDMAWAIAEAQRQGWTQDEKTIANTIRAAARRDAFPGAWQGESRRWYFPKQAFSEYAFRSIARTRQGENVSDLIENFDGDVSDLQRELAAMTRETTGNIPRGQLWQPCEYAGCDNEPVCMNCLLCQETHCHCFD